MTTWNCWQKTDGTFLLPLSKYFLLTWWDETAQHGWVKYHFSKGWGSTVQVEVEISDGIICLAVYVAGEMKPQWLSIKCLYLEVQKSPCIKFTMTMHLYFQQHRKNTFLLFCSCSSKARLAVNATSNPFIIYLFFDELHKSTWKAWMVDSLWLGYGANCSSPASGI